MDRLITNTRISLLVAAVLAATIGVVAWNDPGQTRQGPGHVDSSAWLPTLRHGTVQLVDGTLAADQGAVNPRSVVVAQPGEWFDVVQYGAHALVVNHDDGTVRRVDGSVEQASVRVQPFEVSNPDSTLGDPESAVFAERHADTVWVYSGLARQVVRLDPTTLDLLGDPVAIAGSPDSAVVGSDGTLWAYDVDSGAMKVIDPAPRQGQSRVTSFDVAEAGTRNAVRLIGENPVMVDLSDPTLSVYNGVDDLRQRCDLEVADGADLIVGTGGLSNTMATVVDAAVARLYLYDVQSSTCEHWPVSVGRPGDTVGQPVESEGHVYVPNLTDGRIYVVDLDAPADGAATTDPVLLGADEVELIAEDGQLYFNDPTSARAGVLLEDLGVETFEKFTEGPNGEILVVDPTDEGEPEAPGPVTGPDEPLDGELAGETEPGEDAGPDERPTPDPDPQAPAPTPEPSPSTPEAPTPDGGGPAAPTTPPTPQVGVMCLQSATTVQPGDDVTYEWDAIPEPDSVSPAGVTWTFGDGSDTATGRQVTHAFAGPGTFPVTVEVTDDAGTTHTATCPTEVVDGPVPIEVDIVTVNPSPITDQAVEFQGVINVDDIASWSWTFEGGSPATGEGPSATSSWADPGTYLVTLTVSDGSRTESATTTITVTGAPVVPEQLQISVSGPDRTPLGSTANVSLSTLSGAWTSVQWSVTAPPGGNAPDSTSLVGPSVAFNIDAAGDWVVTATAADDDGTTDTATWTVRGFVEPSGFIDAPTAVTVDTAVTIRAEITPDPGEFRWNVDGTSYVGEFANPIEHTFSTVGTATISLSFDVDGVEYSLPSVTVTVSATTVSVPSVVGMTIGDAQSALSAVGLTSVIGTASCSAGQADGTVLTQDPGGSDVVQEGATITLMVNDHSTGWSAPNYVGQAHAPGGAHAGLPVSTQPVAEPALVGQVLDQTPGPGSFACEPQPVSLVVGTAGDASISCSGGVESASCSTGTQAASVDWGDGTVDGAASHTYAMAGVYTVSYTDIFGNSAQTQVSVLPSVTFTCSVGDGGLGSAATCSVTNPNPGYTYSWLASASGDWAGRSVSATGTTWIGNTSFGWPGTMEIPVTVTVTVTGPGGTVNQAQSVFAWTGCG